MTRPGYLTWRSKQKAEAASQVSELLRSSEVQPPLTQADIERIAALIRKENLSKDEETQMLEDCACLVFLDDQFDGFEKKPEIDEDKIIGILKKVMISLNIESCDYCRKQACLVRAQSFDSPKRD